MSDANNPYWGRLTDVSVIPAYQPGQPTTNALMQPYQPRYLSDNLPFMLMDAYRAAGVPEQHVNALASKVSNAATWLPPVGVLDAASDIGGQLHHGNMSEAALRAALWGGMGVAGYGAGRAVGAMLPNAANRDLGIAYFMERQPQSAPTVAGNFWHGQPIGETPANSMHLNGLKAKVAKFEAEKGGLRAGDAGNLYNSANVNTRNANMRGNLRLVDDGYMP